MSYGVNMNLETKKQQIFTIFEQSLMSVFCASPEFLDRCRHTIYQLLDEVFSVEPLKVVSLDPLYKVMLEGKVPEMNCKEILIFLQSKTQGRELIFEVPSIYENLTMSQRREILRKVSRKIDEFFPETTDRSNVSMDSQEVSKKKHVVSKTQYASSVSTRGESSKALQILFVMVLVFGLGFYFLVLKGDAPETIVLKENDNALNCSTIKGKKPTAICIINDEEVKKHELDLQDKILNTQKALQEKGYKNISILTPSGQFLLKP